MRKILYIVLASATLLFAQVGIARNAHGIRVPSAYTLEQGFVYIGANIENISDGKPLALDGYTDMATGTTTPADNNAAAAGWGMQVGYGVFDFLELGLSLPFYYESEVDGTNLEGTGLGDIQGSAKISVPLNLPIFLSFEGDIYAPTGTKSRGFRPRHAWFIEQEKPSYAYTSGNFTLAATSFISVDFFGILLWNNFGSYLTPMGSGSNVFLWGSGLELFPKKMISLIAEVSGETRIHKLNSFENLLNESARFTPGLRLHLPGRTDLVFGADIGLDFLRGRNAGNGIEIIRKDKDKTIQYEIPSTHKTTFVFAITKTLDFSWKDTDHDGVADRLDMCPGSTFGVMVNNRGCPVDQDQDGVLNIVDDCPNTPFGIEVDFFGCPLDEDKDSIPDYQDKCPGTPHGTAVNKDGCTRDTDQDGIDDNNDLCPETSREEQVNTSGCPIDNDHDGVLNENDKCPETPPGQPVDRDGCPLDYDNDGVPDNLDRCPNSHPDEHVDAFGCPTDQDHDGVPDTKDQCPDTPDGFSVDQSGCPSDNDNDSIPDDLDKCPNTPAGAPVDSTGCPSDSDEDGVADYLDKCPETFPNVLVNAHGCPYNNKLNLSSIAKQVKFHNNKEEPLNSAYTAINDVIELMRRYEFDLEIEVSASGPNAQALSEARAQHIGDVLEIKGFGKKRVNIKAVGSAFPSGVRFTAKGIKR